MKFKIYRKYFYFLRFYAHPETGHGPGWADLDRTGGGGMGASAGQAVTLPNTQTNKKPFPKKVDNNLSTMKAGHSFLNNKMAYISERTGKGNRLLMSPFKKSRKNKKGPKRIL